MFVNNFNSTDPQRPSFFEMFAQQQLISTMKPALRYLFSIIALRSPSWNKAVDYCDEIFHSAQLLVDGFYLSNNSATFSENFYLLHRKFLPPFDPRSVLDRTSPLSSATTSSNVGDNGSPSPLSNKMIASSLLFSVVVPYLKTKADNWYRSHSTSSHFEDVGEVDRVIDFDPDFIVGGNAGAGGIFGFQNPDARGQDGAADGRGGLRAAAAAAAAHFGAHVDHSLRQRLVQSLKRMLLSGYPFFHALYEGLSFVYMLLYMFDYSRYWSFGQHLQKYETRRMTLKELVTMMKEIESYRRKVVKKYSGSHLLSPLIKFSIYAVYFILDSLPFFLPLLIFVFRFIEWWYNQYATAQISQIPIPSPPSPPTILPSGLGLPLRKDLCPVCKEKRTNPTLLTCSGLVFCYSCIFHYVDEHQKCPITQIVASHDHLRKIYETS